MTLQPEIFDKLATLSGDLFFLLDSQGVVLDVSSSIFQELGCPPSDLLKKNLFEIVIPEDRGPWEDAKQKALNSGQPQELHLRLAQGHRSPSQLHGRMCFLPDKKVLLVTLRKSSVAEEDLPQILQKTLEKLNLSLKTAQMGIWESKITPTYPGLNQLKWDNEMRRIHGAPIGEALDEVRWFYDHVHPDDLPDLRAKNKLFMDGRKPDILNYTYRVCWPNGEIHYIDVYGSIDFSEPDQPVKMYGVAKDITQDILKQKLLADQKNRMISNSRLAVLGEISSGIAHEINNPLTVIQARSFQLLQMVEQNNVDPVKLKSAAESISKTGDKIAKIVKSLRAFATNQDNVPFDKVPVSELIQETLDFCKVRFYNHGIEIRVGEIPENLEVECRLIQIEEVLLNLFNNAHDAVLALPEKWISIEAIDRGAEVEIQVTDSGPGIPEEIADKMMLPFFTTKEMGRGMGLGLSIVSDIITKHQGQIYLDHGHTHTRFILRLPKHHHLAD